MTTDQIQDGDRVRIKQHMVGGGKIGIAREGASLDLVFVVTNLRNETGAYYHVDDLEVVQ